ncbi:MAG: hypothetical protein N2321_00270 [Melioribacteraceae bacterium]|nr:hypothetical protein [Melioribacteraceae bacterium]
MKKFLTVFAILFFFTQSFFAQGYNQSSKVLNAGLGFGFVGATGDATIPPISVGLQFGYNEKISVGGIVGFTASNEKLGLFDWEYNYTYILIGARGEYHFMEPTNKLDAYAGLTLGYNVASSSFSGKSVAGIKPPSASAGGVLYGFHAGARYAVGNNWGVFGELGYGIGYITAGAFFKF